MSLEKIINTLVSLDLSRMDAEIYVYIAKKGNQTLNGLANSLNFSNLQLSSSVEFLTNIGLINVEGELLSALPFEEGLELLIKLQRNEEEELTESKKELIT